MEPAFAIVLRVLYKPRKGNAQARKLLILVEANVSRDAQAMPCIPYEFFPATWKNWKRVPSLADSLMPWDSDADRHKADALCMKLGGENLLKLDEVCVCRALHTQLICRACDCITCNSRSCAVGIHELCEGRGTNELPLAQLSFESD